MSGLVLLRHGQSVWNQARRFTGWTDVDLSPEGRREAAEAGQLLLANGMAFDVCFTSVLRRAAETLDIVLDVMAHSQVPVHRTWRLNERHYGALEGLSRSETIKKCGRGQVLAWQQEFDVAPPMLATDDERFPGLDPRYAGVPRSELPRGETIKAVRERVIPYWQQSILPQLRAGKRVLVVAHGNSLRALTTYLYGVADADVARIKRPLTGEPIAYRFDGEMHLVGHEYLRRAPTVKRLARITVDELRKRVVNV